MVELAIRSVTKCYGGAVALDGVSLDVKSGEFVTLLGPSGCGKTTLLRIIAGLVSPTSGNIAINGCDVTDVPTHKRNIGMVFQSHALFSHMRVIDNVSFGLKMRGIPRKQRLDLAQSAVEMVHLANLGGRYPHELSGGQQQRVALARALVFKPDVLLLDEPFAALDRALRESMQDELARLSRKVGITSIFVTHDQEEALILSDRIVVLNNGKIEQVGTPTEIFNKPKTRFVAKFMGGTNILTFAVSAETSNGIVITNRNLSLRVSGKSKCKSAAVEVMLRPEKIYITTEKPPCSSNWVGGVIERSVFHGAYTALEVTSRSLDQPILIQHRSGQSTFDSVSQREVYVVIPDEAVHILA